MSRIHTNYEREIHFKIIHQSILKVVVNAFSVLWHGACDSRCEKKLARHEEKSCALLQKNIFRTGELI